MLLRFTPPKMTEFSAPFLCKVSLEISGGPQLVSPSPQKVLYFQPLPDISYFSASFVLLFFALLPTKQAEHASPSQCCVAALISRSLYPKFHDATIMYHRFTKVSPWPGMALPLAALTSLFISSLIHATMISCCLLVPGPVLGPGSEGSGQTLPLPSGTRYLSRNRTQ